MGMWALEPWDNDAAADWYGDLMDKTKLRDEWLKGINEDPAESPDIVRAAGALFVMLGRVYVWPIKSFDADLENAIAALSKVAACEEYQEVPELVALIQVEIDELKSRRSPKDSSTETPTLSNAKPWWKFW
jgi:hypothetical protein